MIVTLSIAKKEVKSFLSSPMSSILLAIFIIYTGVVFFSLLDHFINTKIGITAQGQYYRVPKLNLNIHIIQPFLGVVVSFGLLIIPLITMKFFSEEKKHRTIKLLLSAPISSFQVVMGKYLGFIFICLIFIFTSCVFPAIAILRGNPEIFSIIIGYLAVFLIFCSFGAIGLFFSSKTENQVLSATLTYVTIALFWLINQFTNNTDALFFRIAKHLSYGEHTFNLIKGVIYTTDIIYFILFTLIWLFFTYQSLESYKWR